MAGWPYFKRLAGSQGRLSLAWQLSGTGRVGFGQVDESAHTVTKLCRRTLTHSGSWGLGCDSRLILPGMVSVVRGGEMPGTTVPFMVISFAPFEMVTR